MQHGGDDLVQNLVVPDALPVVPHNQAVAQADGHFAGVGYRGLAGDVAQEVAGQVVDVAGEEGDGGLALDAAALSLVHGLGHGVQAGGAQHWLFLSL